MKRFVSAKSGRRAVQVKGHGRVFLPTERNILTAEERNLFLTVGINSTIENVFCRIGIFGGLRLAEILNLQVQDIVIKDLLVHVRKGKGGYSRWVNLDVATIGAIKGYIGDLKLRDTDRLFTKSRKTYQRMVERVGQNAGISRVHAHCHMLRHTCATMLLEQGMAVEKVQQQLGHKDIETTQIYSHLAPSFISKSYHQAIGDKGG